MEVCKGKKPWESQHLSDLPAGGDSETPGWLGGRRKKPQGESFADRGKKGAQRAGGGQQPEELQGAKQIKTEESATKR